MSGALRYLSFAGRLVYVGVTSEELHFGHPLMHRRELTLLASRNALSADFSRIIQLIEDGKSTRTHGSRTAHLWRKCRDGSPIGSTPQAAC